MRLGVLIALLVAGGCVIEPRIYRLPSALNTLTDLVRPTTEPAPQWLSPAGPGLPATAPAALQSLARAETGLETGQRKLLLGQKQAAAQAYRQSLGQAAWLLQQLGPQPATVGAADPRSTQLAQRAAEAHDRALLGLLRAVECKPGQHRCHVQARLAELGIGLEAADDRLAAIDWDEIWPAADFVTTHVQDPCRWDGLGVPLVVSRYKRPRTGYPELAYPPRWKFAATAVARPLQGTAEGPLKLVLTDPYQTRQVVTGGLVWPLAADLTTPVIHLLSHSHYRNKGRVGMFIPEKLTDEEGMTTVHPYQPGKIPIVLIHGLGCSPRIMADIVNTIHAHPTLRARYQVFIAYYTSGDTILQDAEKLRVAIRGTRNFYDPAHQDTAWDQMVVLGHSLGGPIARILTASSDDVVERSIFRVPFAQVRVSPETRARVTRSFDFEPVSEITRVIYICGTMHGSRAADQIEGRLFARVIPRRSTLEQFHAEVLANNSPEVLDPRFRKRPPSSIDNQSPESAILAAVNRLRRNPGVITHSIQADATPLLPVERSTDFLVPFESSSIDDASSRVVVPWANHFCTHNPVVLEEITRILHEHLGQR